ncbi:MAG: DUF2950 domain-containing protein [Hyphomicrobiales bacterium]|nr:DUF2950 domain-containing protein [Hyphomicrobiales bacterium]
MAQQPRLIVLALAILLMPPIVLAPTALAQEEGANPWDRFVGAEPTAFDEPAALVAAFESALQNGDVEATVELLGLDLDETLASDGFDTQFQRVRAAAAELITMRQAGEDRLILVLGRDVWPFPFPVVRQDGQWAFDTVAGLDEVINRRVGENEIQAITTTRNYVTAQEIYRETDWDDDGVVEYAQHLISTPETFDGLYWPSGAGVPASPAGAYIEEGALPDENTRGYFGYRFRILSGQGDNIAGGAYDYIINGNMIAGFGLIAWPVEYGVTGVNTFVVNQYGTVYEADLGDETTTAVAAISLFNPDDSWSLVTEVTN